MSGAQYCLRNFERQIDGSERDVVTLVFADGTPDRAVPTDALPDGIVKTIQAAFFGQPHEVPWDVEDIHVDLNSGFGRVTVEIFLVRYSIAIPPTIVLTSARQTALHDVLRSAGFGES